MNYKVFSHDVINIGSYASTVQETRSEAQINVCFKSAHSTMGMMTSLGITFFFLEVQGGRVESVLGKGTKCCVRCPFLGRFNCVARTMVCLRRGCGQSDKAQKFTLVYLEEKT
jgi:hypothetical protein